MKRFHFYVGSICVASLVGFAAKGISLTPPPTKTPAASRHNSANAAQPTKAERQTESNGQDSRPEWTAPKSWSPPGSTIVDADDGTKYHDFEMESSGCEADSGTKILIEDHWTGLEDLLSGSDAVAIVRAGKLLPQEANKPLNIEFAVEEIVWSRGRITVPKSILAGTHAGSLRTPGRYSCSAPLPRQSRRYLAFLFEVDGQWWTASASEGVYEIRGKRLLRMNGGTRGPWFPTESLDEAKRFLAEQAIPADLNESSRGLPKLPPTSIPSEKVDKAPTTVPPTSTG